MNGQLWQECEARRCKAQPVCIDCELCETHCACPPEPAPGEPAPSDRDPQDLTAQWQAFMDALGSERVTCEGPRLLAVTRGEHLPCPAPLPGHPPQLFQRGTTPAGRPVTLAFHPNTTAAYGTSDALDELVLCGVTLTPQMAFDVLRDEYNCTHGFRHALNADAPRLVRVLGRDRLIETARSAPHVRALSGQGPTGPLYPHGEREVQDAHGLSVQWVTFRGYARNLTPQQQQGGFQSLYRSLDGAWYLGNHARTDLRPLSAEEAGRLLP